MNNFTYTRATDANSAVNLFSEISRHNASARFLAGGTNLIDLMREGIEQPRVGRRHHAAAALRGRGAFRSTASGSARWCATAISRRIR